MCFCLYVPEPWPVSPDSSANLLIFVEVSTIIALTLVQLLPADLWLMDYESSILFRTLSLLKGIAIIETPFPKFRHFVRGKQLDFLPIFHSKIFHNIR